MDPVTLEWFGKAGRTLETKVERLKDLSGSTCYRLRCQGVTILLDTWLDRPLALPKYIGVDDITEADYIFISHAHFDQ